MNRIAQGILLFLLCSLNVAAQDTRDWLAGQVTFMTSQNIYIKFNSTQQINKGDTLFTMTGSSYTPCMIVENKSSTSVVAKPLASCSISKGMQVFASVKVDGKKQTELVEDVDAEREKSRIEAVDDLEGLPIPETEAGKERKEKRSGPFQERINGRVSLASYSNFSDTYNDQHRLMGRASLNALNIDNTGWSFEGYATYRRNYRIPNEGGGQEVEDFYRVYNLALTYDIDSSFWVTLGRKINRRASSLGAIDGLQAEKHFGNFYTGAIVGFRPDIFEYDLNTDLFEYGVYTGLETSGRRIAGSTTLGLLEQQNNGMVDRRYLYLQHNSSIGRSWYLFSSAELDLYALENDAPSFKPRLTNLFVSVRYRFSRKLDATISYDSRKQIIFYETLRTEVERLLEDDEARQGARIRVNYRPFKMISTGVSYGKRFQTSQQNPSDNINGFISHSRLPGVGGSMSLNFNWNRSAYLISSIASFRYSRSLIKKYLDADLYYRYVDYQYRSSKVSLQQSYYGASLNYRISGTWALSVLYEFSDQPSARNQRLNTRIIKRFR